ncbi:glycosyltransferase family 2 protein [Gordonia sihwensis]|uniref:glycosyltransferase family 2 protein n=1 Tax=Gordonia sihwensis TaxID=173559 RepID=UPI000698CD02|nr:glycosyltransferase family 2 protein [Gordonia sihwensis]
MTHPTLSVMVPALNEEDSIAQTLTRLCEQIEDLNEIIVVDNGSTDRTAEIVSECSAREPRIRLVSETRPGLIFARNAGFEASTSDLTARLDADTVPHPGWARSIREFFADMPDDVVLATGPLTPFDSPFKKTFEKSNQRLIARVRAKSDDPRGIVGLHMATGGNSVLRTAVWPTIRDAVSDRPDVYEDLDLSLCCREAGYRIAFIVGMAADSSARCFRSSPRSYGRYMRQLPETYRIHGLHGEARKSRLQVLNNRVLHLFTWLPTRAYDAKTGTMSFRRIFRSDDPSDTARV